MNLLNNDNFLSLVFIVISTAIMSGLMLTPNTMDNSKVRDSFVDWAGRLQTASLTLLTRNALSASSSRVKKDATKGGING